MLDILACGLPWHPPVEIASLAVTASKASIVDISSTIGIAGIASILGNAVTASMLGIASMLGTTRLLGIASTRSYHDHN
jgi:hypothetical protein